MTRLKVLSLSACLVLALAVALFVVFRPKAEPIIGANYLPFNPMVDMPEATPPFPADKRLPMTIGGEHVQAQTAEKPHSLKVLKRNGFDVVRLECRPGERRQKASEAEREIDRCEIQFERNFEFRRRYSRVFYFMLEPNERHLSGDNLKFVQDHNANDPGDGALGPTFALQLKGMRLRAVQRTDAAPETKDRVADQWVYGVNRKGKRLEYGQVYKVEIEQVYDWRPEGDGMLKVLLDGETLVDVRGPLGYNDTRGPYPKLGVYRPTDSTVPCAIRFYVPAVNFIQDLGPAETAS